MGEMVEEVGVSSSPREIRIGEGELSFGRNIGTVCRGRGPCTVIEGVRRWPVSSGRCSAA